MEEQTAKHSIQKPLHMEIMERSVSTSAALTVFVPKTLVQLD